MICVRTEPGDPWKPSLKVGPSQSLGKLAQLNCFQRRGLDGLPRYADTEANGHSSIPVDSTALTFSWRFWDQRSVLLSLVITCRLIVFRFCLQLRSFSQATRKPETESSLTDTVAQGLAKALHMYI